MSIALHKFTTAVQSHDKLQLNSATENFANALTAYKPILAEHIDRNTAKGLASLRRLINTAPSHGIFEDMADQMRENGPDSVKKSQRAPLTALELLSERIAILREEPLFPETNNLEAIEVPKDARGPLSSDDEVRQLWANATDPVANGDPYNSRFFLMGLDNDPLSKIYKQTSAAIAASFGARVDEAFWIDFYSHPSRLHEKPVNALSYIGPGQRGTYQNAGFIVTVPPENILVTSPEDWGASTFADKEWAKDRLAKRAILSPESLLDKGFSVSHNEVNVLGTHPITGSRIEVRGIFIKANADGNPLISPQAVNQWGEYANQHRLPPPVFIRDLPYSVNLKINRKYWNLAHRVGRELKPKSSPDIKSWYKEIERLMVPNDDLAANEYTVGLLAQFYKVVPLLGSSSQLMYEVKILPKPERYIPNK